jgi:hypothetical protein
LASVGIQRAILNVPNNRAITSLEEIGRDVIPAVAEL